jgi:hypothetical protein
LERGAMGWRSRAGEARVTWVIGEGGWRGATRMRLGGRGGGSIGAAPSSDSAVRPTAASAPTRNPDVASLPRPARAAADNRGLSPALPALAGGRDRAQGDGRLVGRQAHAGVVDGGCGPRVSALGREAGTLRRPRRALSSVWDACAYLLLFVGSAVAWEARGAAPAASAQRTWSERGQRSTRQPSAAPWRPQAVFAW